LSQLYGIDVSGFINVLKMALSASPAKVTLSLRGLSIVFLFASITLLFISDNSVPEDNGVHFFSYKKFSSYK
jgi:hypothetical protein